MTFAIVGALALAAAQSPPAAGTPVQSNLEYATPIAGTWVYAATTDGSAATFDSTSGRVSAELAAYDPFLDAIASSRGRIGFSTSGLAALVVPSWADVARVIEDCRA